MNILEVVKKLKALADPERNDNAPQREAARLKAEELMAKHGITEQSLFNNEYQDDMSPRWEYDFSNMSPLLRTIFERMASNMKTQFDSIDMEKLIKQQNEARAAQAKRREETTRRDDALRKAFRDWFHKEEKEDD